MTLVLSLGFWLVYCIFEGIREGNYWHNVSITSVYPKYNIHALFLVQRIIVAYCLSFNSAALLSLLIMALTFSFIHNGSYYTTRYFLSNKQIYKKTWFDQSKSSTSVLTDVMTPVWRSIFFLIGAVILVILSLK
jgi:hypothetical protein